MFLIGLLLPKVYLNPTLPLLPCPLKYFSHFLYLPFNDDWLWLRMALSKNEHLDISLYLSFRTVHLIWLLFLLKINWFFKIMIFFWKVQNVISKISSLPSNPHSHFIEVTIINDFLDNPSGNCAYPSRNIRSISWLL